MMIKNTFIEHSIVINNFIGIVGNQIKTSSARVYANDVTYTWHENGNQPVIPDVSINCDIKNRRSTTFLGVPKFIMEVLSDSTEKNDRGVKMELYKAVEVAEYWLVDWRKKQIEIYLLTTDESTIDSTEYRLVNTITETNKEELKLHVFPHVQLTFEQLFDGIE